MAHRPPKARTRLAIRVGIEPIFYSSARAGFGPDECSSCVRAHEGVSFQLPRASDRAAEILGELGLRRREEGLADLEREVELLLRTCGSRSCGGGRGAGSYWAGSCWVAPRRYSPREERRLPGAEPLDRALSSASVESGSGPSSLPRRCAPITPHRFLLFRRGVGVAAL
jgi:hypothetical protein